MPRSSTDETFTKVRSNESPACQRCLSADAECVARRPQRLGRPSEAHTSSSSGDALARRQQQRTSGAGRPRQDSGGAVSSFGSQGHARARISDAAAMSDVFATTSALTPTTLAGTAPPAQLLSPMILSRGSYSPWTWLNADVPEPMVDHGGADEEMAAGRTSQRTELPDIDDLSSDLFDSKMLGTPETLSGGGNACNMPPNGQELVGRLAQLLLDLHLCLGSVRSLDSTKRAIVLCETGGGGWGGGSGSTTPSNSSLAAESVEQAFKAAETFLDVLKLVGQSEPGTATGAPNPSLEGNGSTALFDLATPPNIPDPLDMSTRLMVTSCYTKLLEIFEALVSLLVLSQASTVCSLSTVSLRIGSFAPTTNKKLAVRLLTQYVSHLLDAISAAVENTSCMEGLSHVARETKKVETKLRERISTVR